MVTRDTLFKRNNTYLSAEDDNDFVLIDPETNLLYSLNETGKDIWKLTERQTSVQRVIDKLKELYEVDSEVEHDVIEFIERYSDSLFIVT